MMIRIILPIRTVTESNAKEHWRTKHRRGKSQRQTAALLMSQFERPTLPCVVTLTRVSSGIMDDDNLASSCKHLRDGIADWLGVDDKHRHIVRYEYDQQKGKRGEYAVIVEIRSMEARAAS